MEYDRLPLIDDWSAEFVKILSISVLEHGVILVGMVTGNDSELEHKWSKIFLSNYHFCSAKDQC